MINLDNSLLKAQDSILAIIDIQEKLIPAMPQGVGESVVNNAAILATAARECGVPVIVTEQYSRGLGPTVALLKEALGPDAPQSIDKVVFSALQHPAFVQSLNDLTPRHKIIVYGIESHVCVLQTVLDLLAAGYQVYVAADGVSSRSKMNWKLSLQWMRQAGAVIGSTEMFLFQWLQEAGTEHFKKLSKLIR